MFYFGMFPSSLATSLPASLIVSTCVSSFTSLLVCTVCVFPLVSCQFITRLLVFQFSRVDFDHVFPVDMFLGWTVVWPCPPHLVESLFSSFLSLVIFVSLTVFSASLLTPLQPKTLWSVHSVSTCNCRQAHFLHKCSKFYFITGSLILKPGGQSEASVVMLQLCIDRIFSTLSMSVSSWTSHSCSAPDYMTLNHKASSP